MNRNYSEQQSKYLEAKSRRAELYAEQFDTDEYWEAHMDMRAAEVEMVEWAVEHAKINQSTSAHFAANSGLIDKLMSKWQTSPRIRTQMVDLALSLNAS